MKILQLCAKPPRPLVDGGCIAMNAMSVGLASLGHEIHTIAIKTDKHPGSKELAEMLRDEIASYEEVYVDTRVKTFGALVSLISGTSYNISRFESDEVKAAIASKFANEKFDYVILESLFMMPYLKTIRKISKSKVILRAHNVEHRIWEGLTEDAKGGLKGWYLKVLTGQMKEYEVSHLNEVDAILPIAQEDEELFREFGAEIPMSVTPFGMEFKDSIEQPKVDHVIHFGSMDWKPNQDGVRWLVDEVWPIVRKEKSNARLVLAGRHMPVELKSDHSTGIEVIGEIDDAWEFLQRPAIMTIPVHSGSGMRIKAIEGMSAGRPLVSTTIGAAGLGVTHGVNALIADTASEFAEAIIQLLDTDNNIGSDGNQYVRNRFSFHYINNHLSDFLDTI